MGSGWSKFRLDSGSNSLLGAAWPEPGAVEGEECFTQPHQGEQEGI